MPVLQTQVAWSISYYNPPLPCPGMHAQKLFHVLPHALRVRESLILHRVTLAVTKCHGMVSLKANFHGSQCRNKICDNFQNQLAISESEFSVLGSLCLLLLQFRLIIWAVRSLLISPMTWYSGFFLLSFVTRFACDIGQSAKISIWIFSEVINICRQWMIGRPSDYFITCYTVLTRPNKVGTAVHGCNSWLSVWTTLSCRCPVKLST